MKCALVTLSLALGACTGTSATAPAGPSTTTAARAVNEPAAEWCNGLDDNGDGFPDERFECVQGVEESCVTPCSSWGLRTCTAACTWGDCAPGGEVCNGEDDDCDGDVDEDFGCVRGNVTLCDANGGPARGVMHCDDQCAPSPCAPLGREVCNGEDDDGDGRPDEDFECRMGTREVCDAAAGTDRICSTICTWGACGKTEICNHVDDDMDGKTDEGFDVAWVRDPIDIPDLSVGGEYAASAKLKDCDDEEAVVVTRSDAWDPQQGREVGRHVYVHRVTLDGLPVHAPVEICPLGEAVSTVDWWQGTTRLWNGLTVATCVRRFENFDMESRLYVIDRDGQILNGPDGDVVGTEYYPCALGFGPDRVIWALDGPSPNDHSVVLRTYDRRGSLLATDLPTQFHCSGPDFEFTTDEHGTAIYAEGPSEYVPAIGGISRYYLDLDTGAVLSSQELVPGRGGVESVIDGPGRTLLEYNGGVRAVFDDDGHMVGNKIFMGQGPNQLAHMRGRVIGSSFFTTGGLLGPARVTLDGRDGDQATWYHANVDPDLPSRDHGIPQSTCVTPSGAYVSLGLVLPEVRGDPPVQRLYISDCAQ